MPLKTEEEAIKLASDHWSYVAEVIRNHVNEPAEKQMKTWEKAYVTGFTTGYRETRVLHWVDVLAEFRNSFPKSDDDAVFFHFRTAFKHGKKHRDQDTELTCSCKSCCSEDEKIVEKPTEIATKP